MAVDGILRFDTKIDTDGFSSGTKEISSKMLDLKNKIGKTESEISSLQQELEELANTPVKSSTVTNLEKDIAKAKAELSSLYGQADLIGDTKQADLEGMGLGTDYLDNMLEQDTNWQKIQQQITETEAKLQSYEQELKNVRESESEVSGKDTAEYQRKQQKLQTLSGQLEVYKARLRETEAKENSNANAAKRSVSALERLKNIVSKAGKAMASAFKNATVNIIKKIGSHAKKSSSQMGGLAKSFNMVKQALKGMIVYQGLSKIFDAVKEGMQNLAQVSPQTNKNLSMLMSALTRLKNAFATAFAPILNVVAPILTAFINLMSNVADKIAQLFSALAGNSTYTKAITVQQDYVESIKDTTKATKDNTKANGKNLAGYDRLNVMQQDSSSQKSSKNDLLPKDMFKTVAISNTIKKFADKLRKLFKKQNFKDIGELIGNKLNKALESIDWKSIKKTFKDWAKNIAEFLNGAISSINFKLVGSTIGNGLETAFEFAFTFLTTFDWETFGNQLANALIGFIESIDWSLVGATFGAALNSIILLGFGFVTQMNEEGGWEELGNSISDMVNGFFEQIDWTKAAKALSDCVIGLMHTISVALENIDWEQIGNDVGTFLSNIDWGGIIGGVFETIGGFVTMKYGIITGVLEGLGFADWLDEHLGTDIKGFIDDVKRLLKGLIVFIEGVFTLDWKKAWSGVTMSFSGAMDTLKEIARVGINAIIWALNTVWSFLYAFYAAASNIAGSFLKNLGWFFGQDWGWETDMNAPMIPYLDKDWNWEAPKLATGTVVPANYGEFLAVLGDNKREAEVVSPISTIKQALIEAMAEIGSTGDSGDINLTVNLDGEVIFNNIVKRNNAVKKRHGVGALG